MSWASEIIQADLPGLPLPSSNSPNPRAYSTTLDLRNQTWDNTCPAFPVAEGAPRNEASHVNPIRPRPKPKHIATLPHNLPPHGRQVHPVLPLRTHSLISILILSLCARLQVSIWAWVLDSQLVLTALMPERELRYQWHRHVLLLSNNPKLMPYVKNTTRTDTHSTHEMVQLYQSQFTHCEPEDDSLPKTQTVSA